MSNSKLCEGVFAKESPTETLELPSDMLVDVARQQIATALGERRSQIGDQANNPAQWGVHFYPPVQNPSTTRLSDLPGTQLKMTFSIADPSRTPLGRALDSKAHTDAVFDDFIHQVNERFDGMMASHKALEVSNKALVASHQALEASNKALGANHSVLDRKLTETLEEKTQLTARVCRLSDTISQLKLDAAERKNDAKIFQERASKHRKEMAELLERLDGQARQFEDEIGRLEAKITQQDEKAATSAEVLAGYKRTVTQLDRVVLPLCRRILMDKARKTIYESLDKSSWPEVLDEYSKEDVWNRLPTTRHPLLRSAFELVWDGRPYRREGNGAAHTSASALVLRSVETMGFGADRDAFENMLKFIQEPASS